MRHVLLTIFFLLFIISVSGQDYYPPIENYSTNIYGKNRNPENFAIVQDYRGVMYFGNANGIMEYDGKNWDFIEVLRGAFVHSLCIDKNGTIYVGSNGEFGYLEANDKGLLKYKSLSVELPEMNQFFNIVHYSYVIDNEVFFLARKVLFVYNSETKKIREVKTNRSFHTGYVANNTFYVRERQGGILKWTGEKLDNLEGTSYFKSQACFGVFSLDDEATDHLLFVTNNDGLFKLKNKKLKEVPGSKEKLAQFNVFGAIRLSDNNIALRTFDKGVQIVNNDGEMIHSIDRSTGLRSADVKAMYEDRDQNLWLGLGNGISKVNYYSPLSFYNEKSGIEGNVQTFIRYKGLMYIGSSFGLYIQDTLPESLKEFKQIPTIRNQIWDFEIVGEVLYIATTDGVFKQNETGEIEQVNFINTNTIFLYKDKIVTAGNGGVFVFTDRFNLIWKEEGNLNAANNVAVNPFNEEIWIGTGGSGAIRLKIISEEEIIADKFGEGDGLDVAVSDLVVRPMLFEDSLIFGSIGLLYFYHEDSLRESLRDAGFTEEEMNDPALARGWFEPKSFYDSIFNNELLLIEEDKERTWYVAEHKLGYYNKSEKHFINKPFWGINYGRINNLYLEEDGQLWIGCADGLIRYKRNDRKNYKSDFSSLIRRIVVSNDTLFHGAYREGKQVNVPDIDFENNNLSFYFSSPYFEDEHKPKYASYLEGYDKGWSKFQVENKRIYTNLGAGKYTFKVKSQNIYDQVSEVSEYTFVILPPWYQTVWAYIGYGLVLIILVFAAGRISSMRLKARNEQLEIIVEERTKEISQKNDALEVKNVEISEQKKEIEDSINYAKRIQDAILPLDEEMKKWLPNSFVLYRPKDIVSGDFYWFTKTENKLVIVCADCTGHGVPGAFMSMIGSDRLNIIINERGITAPGSILSELNIAIKNSLKQKSGDNSTKDGMDASICSIDLDKGELVYAGANRPLWIIQSGEFSEIKATKCAIAGFTPDNQVFEEHQISLSKGMKFYMSTDGFADQFGGEKGKKYMVKKMKNMIISISDRPYNEQHKLLESEVLDWMENYVKVHEQIDDICVMGFEL